MDITVIIPCYNCEKTIKKCVDSVFNQTFLPKEIICIDDGSKDNTLDKLYDLQKNSPENIIFTIIKQKNAGPSRARNSGIDSTRTNWIAFLDSDDFWLSEKIEKQVEFLQKNPLVKILGSSNLGMDSKEVTFNMLLFKNYFQTSSTIVAFDCMNKYKFDENQKYSEDYKSWLEIVHENKAAAIYPQMAFPVDDNKSLPYLGNGLSSKVWSMEKGELGNFKYLLGKNKITFLKFITAILYSLARFVRRYIILTLNTIKNKSFLF